VALIGVAIGIGVEQEIEMAFGYEEPGEYRTGEDDPDTDSDLDPEGKRRKQGRQPKGPGDSQ